MKMKLLTCDGENAPPCFAPFAPLFAHFLGRRRRIVSAQMDADELLVVIRAAFVVFLEGNTRPP